MLPRVILIDLDGTLIGKVNCLVCEYDLAHALDKKKVKAVRDAVISRLRYGIIRPHFHAFCKYVQQTVDREGYELFVYTASEAKWASFLVPCIEAALNVKFNRPLFTRNNCIGPECKKSVAKIMPTIFSRLRKRYPAMTHVRDLYPRVILVDNTPTVLGQDDAFRLVHSPTYAYNYVYDVLARLDVDTVHRRFAHIIPILAAYGLYPSDAASHPPSSYQEFAAIYYQRLGAAMGSLHADNARILATDTFWHDFIVSLRTRRHHPSASDCSNNDAHSFDAGTVRSMNACIRSRSAAANRERDRGTVRTH